MTIPILSITLFFVIVFILEYFDRKKEREELFKIKVSERADVQRKYEEIRFLYEMNLSPQEAYYKSIEQMELMYGPMWWYGDDGILDKIQIDKIKCQIDEYFYSKKPKYIIY